MSWWLSTDTHPASEIREALAATQPPAHLSEAQLEQVRVGKKAAVELLDTGVIGDADAERDDNYFSVSLSGHGEEGHGPGDTVTVHVTHQPAPAPSP